jgi:hypothetical protein
MINLILCFILTFSIQSHSKVCSQDGWCHPNKKSVEDFKTDYAKCFLKHEDMPGPTYKFILVMDECMELYGWVAPE